MTFHTHCSIVRCPVTLNLSFTVSSEEENLHSIVFYLIYRMHINYQSILQNHIFTNTGQKYMMLLPFERGLFAVSYSDHNTQIAFATHVESPPNCYMSQISGHTNYAWSVRQPFLSNTGLRFSREMAVVTVRPFQMLCSLCVIDMNLTSL
jgi:hypothetical protein